MKDRQNTINGWILFAGIVALGGTITAGEVFKGERPEHMGYPIEGVEVEAAPRKRKSRSLSTWRPPMRPRASRHSRSASLATMPTRAAPTRLVPHCSEPWASRLPVTRGLPIPMH